MDRRLSPRKHLQLGITLEMASSGQSIAANLLDISMSGAFIETQAPLSNSAFVIMAFKLPDTHLQSGLRLYARVVRRTQTGVGVAFLPMPAAMIEVLIKALSPYEQPGSDNPYRH